MRLDFQQEDGFVSALPLGLNRIKIQRGLTTSSVAVFVPFTTQEIFHGGEALYYGLNATSGNMILADRKRLKTPNGMILGTPGSGKSFSAKRSILGTFLSTKDDILICDPEAEYFHSLIDYLDDQADHLCFQSLLKKFEIKSFDHLIHALGIEMMEQEYPCATETMYGNLSSVDEAIVFRDDMFNLIYSKLREHGCYDTEIAYVIMNRARKGAYHRNGVDVTTQRLLMDTGLSRDFINFLETIPYMFNKATGILYLEKEMAKTWFRIFYPNEYISTFPESDNNHDA